MSESLALALATLQRRFGSQALQRGPGLIEGGAGWRCGIPALDERLTPGGIPRGRICLLEAGGPGPSGRLTLLQSLTAKASREGEVVYLDAAGSLDPGFLADLGADLDAVLVVDPGRPSWQRSLAMARALVGAGAGWLAVAAPAMPLGAAAATATGALVEMVAARRAICLLALPTPVAAPLAHASSLTLCCGFDGWQLSHGDVVGMRARVAVTKNRLGAPGAEAALLLRYPRTYAAAEVVSYPEVVAGSVAAPVIELPAAASA